VKVADASELHEGAGKVVRVEGKSLAIFRVKDEYYALNNNCLHRGGPLGEGNLEGYKLYCPWHGWTYDVRTGSFEVIPTLKVKTYRTRRDGDSIMVDLDGELAPSRPG
jgi:nitrite reductase (NADH) small subunit